MTDLLPLIVQYGYLVLFSFVLAEQIGLPVPAVPVLLGVGALAGTGRMSAALALGIALAASLPPDVVWYELGRRRGGRVLGFLCRISLEPDTCVRRTENVFAQRGGRALLFAKFFPGLSTLAPPLAGIVGIARPRFLLLDSLGALTWAGAWLGLGYVFRDALDSVIAAAAQVGNGALLVAALALAAYIVVKFVRRRLFLRSHRMARITPDDLARRLQAADGSVVIIDTRSALETELEPFAIAGALRIPAEEINRRHGEVPRDRDVVLYCT
jgi:membrane protein DedA with SNARE-associated domain